MLVAVGQVDKALASELSTLLSKGLSDKWDPRIDEGLSSTGDELRDKYMGVLCGLVFAD